MTDNKGWHQMDNQRQDPKTQKPSPVDTVSGIQITLIMLGILVTPALLASASLGCKMPLSESALVIGIGSLILTILAVINISIGQIARLPTYGIIKYSFGTHGSTIINIMMAISLFGWITVTANSFGLSIQSWLAESGTHIPLYILVPLGCIIFVSSTAFGFAVLGKITRFAIPIIIALMLTVLIIALKNAQPLDGMLSTMPFGAAVSSVVGTISVLVVTSADFGSFVHNRKHAIMAGVLTFGIAYPALFFTGAVPSALTGKGSLIGAMAVIGVSLPAIILLILACITGNAGNMFQGTLVLSTLLPQIAKWKITVALGVLASLAGSFDILALLIPFLLFLGIATPPLAGIYVADFILFRRKGYNEVLLQNGPKVKIASLVIWVLSTTVGYLTANNVFTLTSISSLDSIIFAALSYLIWAGVFNKSLNNQANQSY